ncbi:MAG: 4Fe-4S dicluster domain-containing protein [Candidatus Bathyarchaeia archaeon]
MPRTVMVDYKKCTGCRICEIACSTKNESRVSYERSRIRVYTLPPALDIPIVCVQCQLAPCIEACPQEIISRDPKSGAVVIQEDACNGCGSCLKACPAEAIFMHPTRKVAIKCHLCNGDPECVKLCPTGAITYYSVPFDTRSYAKKAERIAEELRKHLLIPAEES